jgi:GTP-binding protein YchF
MKVAIVGLPLSGKSTIFGVVSNLEVKEPAKSHIAAIKVPDERVIRLSEIFQPKKTTSAHLTFVDTRFPFGLFATSGVPQPDGHRTGRMGYVDIDLVKDADVLVHVVRGFRDKNIPHKDGSVDPRRDIENLSAELIMADLSAVETRIERLKKEIDKGRKENQKEYELLLRLKGGLEAGTSLRLARLFPDEEKLVRGYQFLSAKPVLILINADEQDIEHAPAETLVRFAAEHKLTLIHFCGKIEYEIMQLEENDRPEFLRSLGIEEPAVPKFLRAIYQVSDVISFFTVNKNELRVWVVKNGTTALGAAGLIHSDMEKGFIRAEVLNYQTLLECGTIENAKSKGLLRLEGKDYIIREGDIINFRFSV